MAKKVPKVKAEIVTPEEDEKRLSAKRRRFVEEYFVDWNAAQAAVRAGYQPDSANHGKGALMEQPAIQRAIARKQAQLSAQNAMQVQRVMDMLWYIAADPEARQSDRLKALEMIGKRFGMWVDRVETDNTLTIQIDNGIKELGQ